MKAKIRLPRIGQPHLKNWAKTITGIDSTKTNGYAFLGDFVPTNRLIEVEDGSLILVYGQTGSSVLPDVEIELYKVNLGSLDLVYRQDNLNSRSWALEVRDDIATIFHAECLPVSDVPTEEYCVIRYEMGNNDNRWSEIRYEEIGSNPTSKQIVEKVNELSSLAMLNDCWFKFKGVLTTKPAPFDTSCLAAFINPELTTA